jgi:hypothetical protein
MARDGKNPLRHKDIPGGFPPVIALVVTHLPNLKDPYHANRLEIIKISLRSLRKHKGMNAKIWVWDNGSVPELTDWLHDFGPDTLILSENIGKINAQACLYNIFPDETIVAYADDDMFYFPNWLNKQKALLDHFPPALVTGYPTRDAMRRANENTIEWGRRNGKLSIGNFMPAEWHEDYMRSIGSKNKLSTKYDEADILIDYKGMKAYATGHHCQFVTKAGYVRDIRKHVDKFTVREHVFDKAVDDAGILRLATTERLTMHMGNRLDDELIKTIDKYGLRNA